MVDFKIQGDRGVARALAQLPGRVRRKVIRAGLKAGLAPMKAAVRANAPRHTGRTARSVKTRNRRGGRRGEIAAEVVIDEGAFRGTAFYAAFPEFGTRRQPGQHFMERAFEQAKGRAVLATTGAIAAGTAREWTNL